MECKVAFDLCFKCLPHKSSIHNPDHNFESIGPLYHQDDDHESVASHDTKEEVLSAHEADAILEEERESTSDDLDLDSDG